MFLGHSGTLSLAARCLYTASHKAVLDPEWFREEEFSCLFPEPVAEIMNIVLTQKSSNPRTLPCSPDPSAFVAALARCTREEIKWTPVVVGLFLCTNATVGG